jgi:hypothetical protein
MELFLVVLAAAVAGAIWAAAKSKRRHSSLSEAALRRPARATQPPAESRKSRASAGQARQ